MTQYDVVYYTAEHKQKALELVRRLPPEERKARFGSENKFGLRLNTGLPIPMKDGTPSGLSGNCLRTAIYGGLAFMVHQPKDLMLEVIEKGLVVGNYIAGTFDLPQYKEAAEHERAAEVNDKKLRQEYHADEWRKEAAYFMAQRACEILELSGISDDNLPWWIPARLRGWMLTLWPGCQTRQQIERCIQRIVESAETSVLSNTICAECDKIMQEGLPSTESWPEEIAKDPEAIGAWMLSGLAQKKEKQIVRR